MWVCDEGKACSASRAEFRNCRVNLSNQNMGKEGINMI